MRKSRGRAEAVFVSALALSMCGLAASCEESEADDVAGACFIACPSDEWAAAHYVDGGEMEQSSECTAGPLVTNDEECRQRLVELYERPVEECSYAFVSGCTDCESCDGPNWWHEDDTGEP